jgi:transcription elongation factor Elf1
MRTFECLNEECGEESPVGAIDWIDDQHVIQCWHCGQVHALRQLPSEKAAPIRFEVVRPLDD